jgi:hypothetical protein
VDFLLAGKRFSLQGQGLLPAVDVQRLYLWKTFRGKPNSVPGLDEKCSASGRNGVRLRPGMVFGIIPDPCSASARNAVRDQPGIVFALPRNTHFAALASVGGGVQSRILGWQPRHRCGCVRFVLSSGLGTLLRYASIIESKT